MTEFCLSDELVIDADGVGFVLYEDVKEFIKRIHQSVYDKNLTREELLKEIDKLAGEKLI